MAIAGEECSVCWLVFPVRERINFSLDILIKYILIKKKECTYSSHLVHSLFFKRIFLLSGILRETETGEILKPC